MIDKYWNELLQVLTEDENLRIRKSDMVELERTDIVELLGSVFYFEKRMEEKAEQLKKATHGKRTDRNG